ncbi:MAG: c-type cytochrome [Gammaproteobacteria bacterium]|nr:MAG: c-type cytochrome [Gammaproteobacteria bacterium]
MKKTIAALVAVLWVFPGLAQAAGNVAAGKAKSAICAGCHGQGGNSTIPSNPILAGQNAAYIVKQLKAFKSGKRKNKVMAGFAASLNDRDMQNVAAYYASRKPIPSRAANIKALLKQGARLYRGGNASSGVSACMSCHGPSGQGIPPLFPKVSGQHASYMAAQLKAFKSGARKDPRGMMTKIASRMTYKEIRAVSEFMAGLVKNK